MDWRETFREAVPAVSDQPGLFDEPLSGPDLEMAVHESAFSLTEADHHMATLLREIDWQQEEIRMFGKTMPIPRLTAWYGDNGLSYTYSGIEMHPTGWADCLAPLRERVEELAGCNFNSVLLNLYRSGEDGVSWHADDEADLGTDPTIGSISLGAARKFQFRRINDPAERRELMLHSGDVIVMSGPTQRFWHHQIPKTSKPVDQRINLTFRRITGS